MRWDDLFGDLEAQLAAAGAAEVAGEVADRVRRESALLGLVDRARAAVGHPIVVRVLGAGPVDGVLTEVGSHWLLVTEAVNRQVLVPLASVVSLAGLRAWTAVPGSGGQVVARLGLGAALRGIARDRLPVQVWLTDSTVLTGTVDRVGADFVEITEHGAGESPRHGAATGVRTVPFAGLALVRSGP